MDTSKSVGPHTCSHCQIILDMEISSTFHNSSFRIPLPHSLKDARRAARDGCPIFVTLMRSYSRHSQWRILGNILRGVLYGRRTCRADELERVRYLFRSLGSTPFEIAFGTHANETQPQETNMAEGAFIKCSNLYTWSLKAYAHTDDAAASIFPSFDLNVYTETVVSEVKKWLATCKCHQPVSSETQSFMPTRVVDVDNDTTTTTIEIMETKSISASEYLCLSYCWGGKQPITCTTQTMPKSGKWSIPVEVLPATIRDAITVTKRLGYRYLWVDALCIVQDDPSDVEGEISKMPEIYKNSQLTICASSASSCRDGFLQPRPDRSEYVLRVRLPGNKLGEIHLDSMDELSTRRVGLEPLGARAWAVQERILSPRLLEYGAETARWSCRCSRGYSGSSTFPAPRQILKYAKSPTSHLDIFDYLNLQGEKPSIPRSVDDLFQSWTNLVERYSSCSLTFTDDKLAGISGMARELGEQTGAEYLAGLWRTQDLPQYLAWYVNVPLKEPENRKHKELELLRRRPLNASRAPSWSWAAVDNLVSFHFHIPWESEVVFDKIEVVGSLGTSAQGTMVLRGAFITTSLWREYENASKKEAGVALGVFVEQPDHCIQIFPDCMDEIITCIGREVSFLQGEVTFLRIGRQRMKEGPDGIHGLLLKKALGHYIRVGFFTSDEAGHLSPVNWKMGTFSVE